jgi:preprotein translocase subunit SecG
VWSAENWVNSSRAYIEVDESLGYGQYLSIKGSYLSDQTRSCYWLLSHPNYSSFYDFRLDGYYVYSEFEWNWKLEDGQYIDARREDMFSGWRYSFYVRTEWWDNSGWLWLALEPVDGTSGREYFGSDNCDLCDTGGGCIDTDSNRYEGCPQPTPRLTPHIWETGSPRPTPTARATPLSSGVAGVLISRHSEPFDEEWSEASSASVSIDTETAQYISIKGSYLCTADGSYTLVVYTGTFGDDWFLIWDDWFYYPYEFEFDYSGQFYYLSIDFTSGWRYPFYFSTREADHSTSVSIALQDTSGNLNVLSSANTETSNTSYCNNVTASRRSGCVVPDATATPRAIGTKGVLYTKHVLGEEENWTQTSVAEYSGSDESGSGFIVGLSGSYLCEANDTYEWVLSGVGVYWRFIGGSVIVPFEGDSETGNGTYPIDMVTGFRYPYRLLTVAPATQWYIAVSVKGSASAATVLNESNSETAETDGCVDPDASVADGCIAPTFATTDDDVETTEGGGGNDSDSGGVDTMLIIIIVVVVVVVIVVIIIGVVIWKRKKKDADKVEDGEEAKSGKDKSGSGEGKKESSSDSSSKHKGEKDKPPSEAAPETGESHDKDTALEGSAGHGEGGGEPIEGSAGHGEGGGESIEGSHGFELLESEGLPPEGGSVVHELGLPPVLGEAEGLVADVLHDDLGQTADKAKSLIIL